MSTVPPVINDRELSSWKEIATHLGVTVRTAQKWEHERGLPVRHLPGPRRGRVLITVGELEAWKRSSDTLPTVAARHRWWRLAVPILAVVLGVVAVLAWPRPGAPARYRVQHDALIVMDRHGRELWRKPFDGLQVAEYTTDEKLWFGDLDGSGTVSVVFLVHAVRQGVPESLIAYNHNGVERWRFTPGRTVHTSRESFAPLFHPARFLVAPFGRDGKLRIAVASTHHEDYPSQIALLDNNGHLLREYWHSGHLPFLLATDVGQGWNVLLAAGISNARKAATLLVLDPDHFTGASKEDNAAYQLQDLPPPVEAARLLFPRSCINEKLEPYAIITKLWKDGDTIALEVQHRASPPDATIFYHLNPDLTLNTVDVGTSFERAHLALHASGIIDHDLTQAEAAKFRHLTYLTGEPYSALNR
jgi:hypothetical protein